MTLMFMITAKTASDVIIKQTASRNCEALRLLATIRANGETSYEMLCIAGGKVNITPGRLVEDSHLFISLDEI